MATTNETHDVLRYPFGSDTRAVIIGAGPAGLAAAKTLDALNVDYVVIEASGRIGGLCQSFWVGDTVFDTGGHAFFSLDANLKARLFDAVPQGVYTQPRRAWVSSHGTFVPYPFQANLHGLPTDVVVDCLVGLTQLSPSVDPPRSISEWIDQSFGAGIATHFLTPYNEKVWAYPLSEVAPEWISKRVVRPDPRELIAGALCRRSFDTFPNAQVSYPSSGGFEEFYLPYQPPTNRLITGCVTKVDARRKRVTVDGYGDVDYSHLVSTMPLDTLLTIDPYFADWSKQARQCLHFNSVELISVALKSWHETNRARVYSADPDVPFNKLIMNSMSSPWLMNRRHFGVQGEVSFSSHRPIVREGLIERFVSSLISFDLITSPADVAEFDQRTITRAYPVRTLATGDFPERAVEWLEGLGIYSAGRFGEWLYINSDDAFKRGEHRGQAVAASLLGALP